MRSKGAQNCPEVNYFQTVSKQLCSHATCRGTGARLCLRPFHKHLTKEKSTPKNSSLSEDSSDDLYHCIVEHKARRVESWTAQKEEHLKYPLSDLPALNRCTQASQNLQGEWNMLVWLCNTKGLSNQCACVNTSVWAAPKWLQFCLN